MELFLDSVRCKTRAGADASFPFSVPTIASFECLQFEAPVTFFMGENGSGKSTLLEALAVASHAVTVGAQEARDDSTLAGARTLAATLTLTQRRRPSARIFFRAEDAFGFTRRIEGSMRDIEAEAKDLLTRGEASPEARRRAAGFINGQRAALASQYGDDPHALSHGETFLNILRSRLAPRGLYLLDEPETPLSPTRVLALLALVNDAVNDGSQFVIATHSPILAALPSAQILLFQDGAIRRANYEDLEHVRVTRDFLNAPHRYLRHLVSDGSADE